ncbi:cyclic nucleotide-binding domain-containing protein [Methylotenera mobilis]|uniref:Putative transcriptional regulator, Crp/Fnr family n=1 Tax=Methylotenera mobilis (strain JLW8 / ATCC BAA-1282 / DSM 17540) TaxID=583345 RepID=C6WXQ4_METML|nr:cyclic nucleotide-binding domain-containing protein [Methylotenera mobilis]ACT48703.1 putative transcriptional regulator, Crp/Fnr family [Methylotenera mobilis JLW8]
MAKNFLHNYPDLLCLGKADQYVDEICDMFNQNKIFGGFDYDEAKILCGYMQCYAAPRGYKVMNEGDEGDFMLLVLSGEVVVRKNMDGMDNQYLVEVKAGGVVGEMGFVDSNVRFASCVTTMPTDFAVMTRATLNDLLLQHPRMANKLLLKLLQVMGARIRETVTRLIPEHFGVTK